ncbi:hypothetical protein DAI22_11g089200 [Oryza sativa Japonica Group]|nr:hypothetical protein DAI22_11g089200 [Oryza sativa Japonica Group]
MEESLDHHFPLKLGITICSRVFPMPPIPTVLRCSSLFLLACTKVIKETRGIKDSPVLHHKNLHLRIFQPR